MDSIVRTDKVGGQIHIGWGLLVNSIGGFD